MGVVKSFGDVEGLFYTTQLVDEWFDESNRHVAV